MNRTTAVLIALSFLPLAGCGPSGEDELRQWMADERAQTKPRVTPITEPKQFQPQAYTAEGSMEPFNPLKLTQALRRDSAQVASNAALIAPEMARRKEPLEAFPLDTMSMVGSLEKSGKPTALLKVDNLLYQVQAGSYLGQNYGRITKITETAIQMREIVQDATGDWIERTASLELQEGAKK
ncbi:pilus assembly protein PilP [Acidovorax sp. SRB_14]|uniref:pilus assembly protein PilP n=1 Tax=unclassified Acidovorax TaxID=2684926 RepID=UPI00145F77A0|nr:MULTISPECIES: pilus assembly protein PilP [unclassified Acidovorax]NMM77361.1 pilus assembly protein PilP [Acidovorax sp. SRB_24]NMM82168.1 pilus assembly protein PilP [Acidovorax sp. SRB_14]NMM85347.1 pilus assembly protein PilP [Rhodococcus sp. SRB_17]